MLRPEAYRALHVALQSTPYICQFDSADSPQHGMISTGQTVWLQAVPASPAELRDVIGFLDEIGLVALDARCLARMDIFRKREN